MFESITSSIMKNIIEEFSSKGVMPISKHDFYYCHLSPSLRKSVLFCDSADGSTAQGIEIDFDTTIDDIRDFDKEVAKSLLRYIQNSGNIFDTDYGFSTILYNSFQELGIFNMTNTLVKIPNDDNGVSVFRNGDALTVYYNNADQNGAENYTFIQQIMFGNSKNFIKFAMWKETRTENIQILYDFLYFVVSACREEKKVTKYPDINKEIGTIYLQQLKALENAI